MRVATATSRDVVAVFRDPFHRTLWTYYHLQQFDRVDELQERGRALHRAALMSLVFYEPKKLDDEYRRFEKDAGLLPTVESTLKHAEWIVAAVEQIDKVEGRR